MSHIRKPSPLGNTQSPPGSPAPDWTRASRISWRKIVLQHRAAVLLAWRRHFPEHNFTDLRWNGLTKFPRDWRRDAESWAAAARAYHRERNRGSRP
jgi:hypothetical protein